MTTTSSPEILGRILKDTYRIDAFLGEGGPSIVYRGLDILLGIPVAIKRLKTAALSQQNASMAERFLREARTQSRLVHQNIVGIRAMLEDQGDHFIVMEFIDGPTLEDWLLQLPKHQTPLEQILPLFSQILAGLGYAHENKVVHRDIKPSNVLIGKPFVAKLADFGIAHAIQDHRLTKTGAMLGTLLYMSPEQIRGEEITHRCDIYSLGLSLYEAIAGHHPFCRAEEEITGYEVMSRHLFETAPLLSNFRHDLPQALEPVIQRSIAKNPLERFESCEEFAYSLEEALASVSPTYRRAPSSSMMLFQYPKERPSSGASGGILVTDDLREPLPTPAPLTPSAPPRQTASALPRFEEALTSDIPFVSPAASPHSQTPPPPSLVPQRPQTPPPPSLPSNDTLLDPSLSSHPSLPLASVEASHPSFPPKAAKDKEFLVSVVVFSAILWFFGLSFLFVWHRFFRFPPPTSVASTNPPSGHLAQTSRRMPPSSPNARHQGPPPASPRSQTSSSGRPTGLLPRGRGTPSEPGPSKPANATEPSEPRDPSDAPDPSDPPDPSASSSPPSAPPSKAPLSPSMAAVSPGERRPDPAPKPDISGMIEIKGGIFVRGHGSPSETVKGWARQGSGLPFGLGQTGYRKHKNDHFQQRITVDTFWLDRFEVSVGEYKRCIQAGACQDLPVKRENEDGQRVSFLESLPKIDDIPIHYTTWDDAKAFCLWAKKRLPTEAEWELAARGLQDRRKYPWGNEKPSCEKSIHQGCKKVPQRAKRQEFLQTTSPSGIRDLSGNLWEWVADCYRPHAYASSNRNPRHEDPSCSKRILRGGSFQTPKDSPGLTVYYRRPENPDLRKEDIGFRCAFSEAVNSP